MQDVKRLIVDASSVVKTALFAGIDKENGRTVEFHGKTVQVNSAQYGYDNAINSIVSTMKTLDAVPSDLIIVIESGNSKMRRTSIYSGYKVKREESPELVNRSYGEALEMFCDALRNLGAVTVNQPHVEADDVIAFLARNLGGQKIIVSNDGDMATLLAEPNTFLFKSGQLHMSNPYGDFDPKFIPLMKSLIGDGNEYKGATGFGPKAWENMLKEYKPYLANLEALVAGRKLDQLADDVADFPPFQKVIDSATHVYESYQCALLHDEWVDTLRAPLTWKGGVNKGADDYRLREFAQKVTAVTRGNLDEVVKEVKNLLPDSPFVTLDIETSSSEESDEWMASRNKDGVDVLGAMLTGLGLTLGKNSERTFYFSVDHAEADNIDSEVLRQVVALIPQTMNIVCHNAVGFELPVLLKEWGKQQEDNGWMGMLPNVVDTMIMSSYVNENLSKGLKQNSLHWLDYEQESYEEVTTVGEVQLKMNELTLDRVLKYGADDTICTAALYRLFRAIMEVEKTYDLMLEVEQGTSYVCALAYTQGINFSLQKMLQLEKEDQEAYNQAWSVIRSYLLEKGWHGTVPPTYTEMTPANIKEAVKIILGWDLVTMVRTPSKLAAMIRDQDDSAEAETLATAIEAGDLELMTKWAQKLFKGEPEFDSNSPKQMKAFLYDLLELPVRVVGSPTELERTRKPELANAVYRHKKIWAGSETEPPLTETEKELLKQKAKTNETAVDFALLMDRPNCPILDAFKTMKKCQTRQQLFYNNYKHVRHWTDNKIHGQQGQSLAVTRRFTPYDPNFSQLPKKGEGVKFRDCFEPHHKDAVVFSCDFAGQELRQGAGQSMDPNMLACFVGDNLKDMHSLTAAGAMEKKWGKDKVAEMAERFGKDEDTEYDLFLRLLRDIKDEDVHKMADDLRKVAKNVNFGAQYDAQAPKLAETIVIPVADAELLLEAKYAMFPRFEKWKDEVKAELLKKGYVTTCMGARRHLREAVLADSKWEVERALRQGPNFCIQASSAEQTKLAMSRIWKSGILSKLDMVFYAPIHDELVWSVHKDDAIESAKVINAAMTVPYGNLPVPFLGSISLARSFMHEGKHEAGDTFDPEKIQEILDMLFEEEGNEAV